MAKTTERHNTKRKNCERVGKRAENHERYYNWSKTLTYDAPITMVIAARGRGKTFGLRLQFVQDYLKNGWRFVEIARTRAELPGLMRSYFDRIGKEYPNYVFKTDKSQAFISLRQDKPKWEPFGYFVAMSRYQALKKQTFNNVRRILLDEAVMESADRYHKYQPDEWNVLANIVDTVAREREGSIPPRIYLLGNATDILNPYFEHAGITGNPPHGYSWYLHKTFLLDYDDSPVYAAEKAKTVAGMMESGLSAKQAIGNKFVEEEMFQRGSKSKDADPVIGLSYNGHKIGIWLSMRRGWYYVSRKMPAASQTYALALIDRPNYLLLRRVKPVVQLLYEAYGQRLVLFDCAASFGAFLEMMQYLGIKR